MALVTVGSMSKAKYLKQKRNKLLLQFLKPFRKQFAFIFCIGCLTALFDTALLLLVFDFLRMLTTSSVLENILIKKIAGVVQMPTLTFNAWIHVYMVLLGCFASFRFFTIYSFEKMTSRLKHRGLALMQNELMSCFLHAPWKIFCKKKHGEIIFHLINAPAKVTDILSSISRVSLILVSTLIVSSALFLLSPFLFLIGFILVGLFLYISNYFAKKISYHSGRERVLSSIQQNESASEVIAGMRYIKSYGLEQQSLKGFDRGVQTFGFFSERDSVLVTMPRNFMDLFIIIGLLSMTVAFMMVMKSSFISVVPILGTYFYGLIRLMPSASQLGTIMMQISGNIPYIESYFAIKKELQPAPWTGTYVLNKEQSDALNIRFKSVTFEYEKNKKVLDNASFSIPFGNLTVIWGPSGIGKSTILDLILGLNQPVKGNIWVNDMLLSNLDLKKWRSKISLVGQDTFLFHDTLEANLRVGRPGASWAEMNAAVQIAGIDQLIYDLPDQWKTLVGDRGMKLSGGQRQRLSLARAILRNPALFLLDEVTSGLDQQTEQEVMVNFLNYTKGKTVIMVTHKKELLKYAQHVVQISDGKIVESQKISHFKKKDQFFLNRF